MAEMAVMAKVVDTASSVTNPPWPSGKPPLSWVVIIWLFNSLPWYRWPIEIDGLPNLKMGGSFHGYVTNSQRVSH